MLATGTSCRTQIGDLGGRAAVHPLEFLAGRLVALTRRARRRAVRVRRAGLRAATAVLAPRRRRPCTMALVNWVILIAGVAGLLVAGYGLVGADPQRACARAATWDIAIAARGRVVAVVLLLVAFGDRLIR